MCSVSGRLSKSDGSVITEGTLEKGVFVTGIVVCVVALPTVYTGESTVVGGLLKSEGSVISEETLEKGVFVTGVAVSSRVWWWIDAGGGRVGVGSRCRGRRPRRARRLAWLAG